MMVSSDSNVQEFSVSELSFSLKRTVEDAYEHVRVRGEVSGFRGPATSGHCYFTLKDERATLDAIVWKSTFRRLRFEPEEGLEMIATGKLTTYPGRSKYQIVIDQLEPAGAGALMALLEERRRKLAAEGLFDQDRKVALPYLPETIGVVTSPTGAVIRDILHRLGDRCPTQVLLWPVRVQGETSAAEVAAGLRGFNRIRTSSSLRRPDVLVVARGGGSIEDLWPFNEEITVRAVAESDIPVVSAVGHETDWTLIDLVADQRAPTPTGAAEMIVPVRSDLIAVVGDLGQRLINTTLRSFQVRQREVSALSRGLPVLGDLVALPRQRLDHSINRLSRSLVNLVSLKTQSFVAATRRHRPDLLTRAIRHHSDRIDGLKSRLNQTTSGRVKIERAAFHQVSSRLTTDLVKRLLVTRSDRYRSSMRLLETLSHRSALKRGFAMVRDRTGRIVRSTSSLSPGDGIAIEFSDGFVDATIVNTANNLDVPAKSDQRDRDPVKKPGQKSGKSGQGSLF